MRRRWNHAVPYVLMAIAVMAVSFMPVAALGDQENQFVVGYMQTQAASVRNAQTESFAEESDQNLSGADQIQLFAGATEQEKVWTAGEILEAVPEDPAVYFTSSEIPQGGEVYERINGRSYYENDDITLADLRYLTILHYNYDHKIQTGELIVNASVAEDMLEIFTELYETEYELESVRLIDDFWQGDGASSDTASMEANNTSAFCYRQITGSSTLSNHAYGCAIDINPLQNPYVWHGSDGSLQCQDPDATPYLDRNLDDPHIIRKGDICDEIFSAHDFSWGGDWTDPIDYQHYEKREAAE